MTPLNLGVIILAAGGSSRLGSPKQLLPWRGETLLQKAVREAAELSSPMIHLSRIVVVLGANYEAVRNTLIPPFACFDLVRLRSPANAQRQKKAEKPHPDLPQKGRGKSKNSPPFGREFGWGSSEQITPELTILRNEAWQTGMASSVGYGMSALGGADVVLMWLCDQPLVTAKHLGGLVELYLRSGKGIAASRYADSPGVPAVFGQQYFAELHALSGGRGAQSLFYLHAGDMAMYDCPEAGFDIDTAEDYHRALALIP